MFSEILCTNPRSFGSWLLRVVMWSRWSHSAVLDHTRMEVYEATIHRGVRRVTADEFIGRYGSLSMRSIGVPLDRFDEARAWLDAQCGKRYDWTAFFGFLVRYFTGRHWQDSDAWDCSELSETFRAQFARPRFRADLWRVTPGHQDMVL